ncbi:hypothetical protein AC249_AIPGENE16101, partial [Exaiptasia diaphana]
IMKSGRLRHPDPPFEIPEDPIGSLPRSDDDPDDPIENYTLDRPDTRMGYDLPRYSYNSDVLVLPNISPTMMVMVGDEFRIWYGEDLKNTWEADNSGQTCAEVYVLYTEFL